MPRQVPDAHAPYRQTPCAYAPGQKKSRPSDSAVVYRTGAPHPISSEDGKGPQTRWHNPLRDRRSAPFQSFLGHPPMPNPSSKKIISRQINYGTYVMTPPFSFEIWTRFRADPPMVRSPAANAPEGRGQDIKSVPSARNTRTCVRSSTKTCPAALSVKARGSIWRCCTSLQAISLIISPEKCKTPRCTRFVHAVQIIPL